MLLDVTLHDPLPELRRRIRGRLEDIAAEVPWVEAALDAVFDQLHADPTQPEITDRESLAPLLRQVGPATHKAVAMLLVEPALIDGPVIEPLLALTERALRGELDQSLTADVARAVMARFGAQTFAEPACAMLRRADESPVAAGRLAVGLAWAAPGDPEIFDALVACAGGNPHPLTSAALHVYDLPVPMKCDALGRGLLRPDGFAAEGGGGVEPGAAEPAPAGSAARTAAAPRAGAPPLPSTCSGCRGRRKLRRAGATGPSASG